MMTVDTAAGRVPLVLLVDSTVSSRHVLWRVLHRAFGVLEADSAASARTWLGRRPDIDALVLHGDLLDGSAEELALEWLDLHPGSRRPVVLATSPTLGTLGTLGVHQDLTRVDVGDLGAVVDGLASWLSARDGGLARLLVRDADRLIA